MTPSQAYNVHVRDRRLAPALVAIVGVALYALMISISVPRDLPGYWDEFLTVNAGQIGGLALGTCLYFAGLGLCVVAVSSLLPIRSPLMRRLLSVPGLLSAIVGAIQIVAILICFTDKLR